MAHEWGQPLKSYLPAEPRLNPLRLSVQAFPYNLQLLMYRRVPPFAVVPRWRVRQGLPPGRRERQYEREGCRRRVSEGTGHATFRSGESERPAAFTPSRPVAVPS